MATLEQEVSILQTHPLHKTPERLARPFIKPSGMYTTLIAVVVAMTLVDFAKNLTP